MDKNNRTCKAAIGIGLVSAALALSAGCQNTTKPETSQIKGDGDLAVPTGYQSWAKFVPTVDKVKAGQVREIYINDVGMQANKGDNFPYGTTTVMEIYAAKKAADGSPQKDADGRLVKDKLAKIFVMSKGEGWGDMLPATTIKTGDWLYSAYQADASTPATQDFSGCRSCHTPLKLDDYVARYDEHFYHK
ncbi:cytochrome P460 family protein [Pontibacter sp. JAM-7]|uniref:cytochrome P460 family protein n=1 Tax=Pontibacter sp. JAM-7 TaxID=3366581 RepID=UPI003AF44E2C